LPSVRDAGRVIPQQAIAPGETVSLNIPLTAPAVAGNYDLEYDLVFENVSWFASHGSRPPTVPMRVH